MGQFKSRAEEGTTEITETTEKNGFLGSVRSVCSVVDFKLTGTPSGDVVAVAPVVANDVRYRGPLTGGRDGPRTG